jgi:hypothetical protein
LTQLAPPPELVLHSTLSATPADCAANALVDGFPAFTTSPDGLSCNRLVLDPAAATGAGPSPSAGVGAFCTRTADPWVCTGGGGDVRGVFLDAFQASTPEVCRMACDAIQVRGGGGGGWRALCVCGAYPTACVIDPTAWYQRHPYPCGCQAKPIALLPSCACSTCGLCTRCVSCTEGCPCSEPAPRVLHPRPAPAPAAQDCSHALFNATNFGCYLRSQPYVGPVGANLGATSPGGGRVCVKTPWHRSFGMAAPLPPVSPQARSFYRWVPLGRVCASPLSSEEGGGRGGGGS